MLSLTVLVYVTDVVIGCLSVLGLAYLCKYLNVVIGCLFLRVTPTLVFCLIILFVLMIMDIYFSANFNQVLSEHYDIS